MKESKVFLIVIAVAIVLQRFVLEGLKCNDTEFICFVGIEMDMYSIKSMIPMVVMIIPEVLMICFMCMDNKMYWEGYGQLELVRTGSKNSIFNKRMKKMIGNLVVFIIIEIIVYSIEKNKINIFYEEDLLKIICAYFVVNIALIMFVTYLSYRLEAIYVLLMITIYLFVSTYLGYSVKGSIKKLIFFPAGMYECINGVDNSNYIFIREMVMAGAVILIMYYLNMRKVKKIDIC